MMMSFDRFTERAQEAAARAYQIMQRYRHSQLDTEHILLALLEQPEGVILQILKRLNVDADAIRNGLDDVLKASPRMNTFGSGAHPMQVHITPRVKRILDGAAEESQKLNDEYTNPSGEVTIAAEYGRQASGGSQESDLTQDESVTTRGPITGPFTSDN